MRQDRSFTLALCASLAVHTLVAGAMLEAYVRQVEPIRLAALPIDESRMSHWITVPEDALGEDGADGYAVQSAPGEKAMQAREAPQDQALLSRDPVGPGHPMNLPSMSTVPQGGAELDAETVSPAHLTPVAIVSAIPILPGETTDETPFGVGPDAAEVVIPQPTPRPPAPQPVAAVAVVVPDVVPVPSSEPSAVADVQPGVPVPPADPAPMSESESDAFSQIGSATFRDGQLFARTGRPFKSVRPRLSLAQQIELLGISSPRIGMKLKLDAAGHVTDVDVLSSTGSASVDQTIKVTMYEWWFEPAKDAAGQPIEDVYLFEIAYY